MSVQITFGSPKQDCRSLGICRIESAPFSTKVHTGRKPCNCTSARAMIQATHNDRLVIHFIKSSLHQNIKQTYFADNRFCVQDEFDLDEHIALQLGLRPGQFIRPGFYRVVDLGNHMTVSVQLSRRSRRPLPIGIL